MNDRVRLEPRIDGNGNGGGHDGDPKLTVTMTAPPPSVTGAEPGVGLLLSGELTQSHVTGITVQLVADGRRYPATTGMTGLTRTWSGTVRFYRAGNVQVHAEVSGTSGLGTLTAATAPVTVAVTLTSAVPLYTVESPQPGPVGVGEAGETLPLRVRSSNQFGPRAVSWSCEGNSGQAVQDQADTTLFTAAVPLTALPLGNRTISVQLQDAAGNAVPTTVTVQALDVTPPHVQITWPPKGQAFTSGTPITMRGHAQDGQSGMTGGRVEWSLTGGAPFTTATSSNNWADWQAPVSIGDFGAFTITIRAVDAAGNVSTPQELPVQMVSSYQPTDIADRLSSREYLAALLTVIRDTVRTAAGTAVASSDLEALLGQPFARLSQPLSAVGNTGDLLVNELRVPVEVLRRYPPHRACSRPGGPSPPTPSRRAAPQCRTSRATATPQRSTVPSFRPASPAMACRLMVLPPTWKCRTRRPWRSPTRTRTSASASGCCYGPGRRAGTGNPSRTREAVMTSAPSRCGSSRPSASCMRGSAPPPIPTRG